MPLTVEEVRLIVDKVRAMAHDDEAAHSEEDHLYEVVLLAIAMGDCDDPAACCKEALATQDIQFSRWLG